MTITHQTGRELRDGADKWTLKHLPPGTAARYTNEVVPLLKEIMGTKEPWKVVTVSEVQEAVDRVFGKGQYPVAYKSAWYGLVRPLATYLD